MNQYAKNSTCIPFCVKLIYQPKRRAVLFHSWKVYLMKYGFFQNIFERQCTMIVQILMEAVHGTSIFLQNACLTALTKTLRKFEIVISSKNALTFIIYAGDDEHLIKEQSTKAWRQVKITRKITSLTLLNIGYWRAATKELINTAKSNICRKFKSMTDKKISLYQSIIYCIVTN